MQCLLGFSLFAPLLCFRLSGNLTALLVDPGFDLLPPAVRDALDIDPFHRSMRSIR